MSLVITIIVSMVIIDLTITLTGLIVTTIVAYQANSIDSKVSDLINHIEIQEHFVKVTSQ